MGGISVVNSQLEVSLVHSSTLPSPHLSSSQLLDHTVTVMAAKRLLEGSDQDSNQPEDKRMRTRPSFATVIQEAIMAKSLQNFFCALEPLLRRVVQEEVERGLVDGAQSLQKSPLKQIQVVESSSLQLSFGKRLTLPIFTGSKIEDEDNNPLQIILIDNHGGRISHHAAPIKIEIVVIDGDFPSGEQEHWTSSEFESKIVKERTGRRPLLNGDVQLTLRDGIASVGELMFTDNSSWIRGRHFRIGAKVTSGSYQGLRIREAMTEPFTVKDHRGELYRKHHPPSLDDEVWRLERIGKDGVFHKKLMAEGIKTVQEFLKLWVVDPNQLRRILGGGMSDRMWEGTVNHARTCVMGSKFYLHRGPRCAVILNPICQVVGTVIDGLTYSPQNLAGSQRAYVEQLVLQAYTHWETLEEVNEAFGDGALVLNEWMPQDLMESASGPPILQDIAKSNYQIEGLEEVEAFADSVQVEFSGWLPNPNFMMATIQQGQV